MDISKSTQNGLVRAMAATLQYAKEVQGKYRNAHQDLREKIVKHRKTIKHLESEICKLNKTVENYDQDFQKLLGKHSDLKRKYKALEERYFHKTPDQIRDKLGIE